MAPGAGGDGADRRSVAGVSAAGKERLGAVPVRRMGVTPRWPSDEPPAGGHPPLRHVDGGAAAIGRRDLRHIRRSSVPGAHQLPRLRTRARFPHVGRP